VIAGTLAELTQELENYRLEKIKEQNTNEQAQAKPQTPEEKAEAIKNLQHENLLEQTISDLQASGIQGEPENALILLLAMTSRKTPDPISVICLARSGSGKSYLMEKVANCMPEEDKREHTQFTGNAFYYFKRHEISGKVFLIEDLEGALNALFPIRELQSKKRISKTITQKGRDGKPHTVTLIVEGPVSVIACTTKESVYEDNANRSILIYLDDSKEQDERIMDYQKKKRAGLIDSFKEKEIQTKLQQMQKALEPIKVVNRYAPLIDLPENFPKKRRALPIILNVIEAITFYHQCQREQTADKETGELQIETHPGDIENGFKYLKNILFRKSDELSGAVRDFFEEMKRAMEKKELPAGQTGFKVADIRSAIKLPPRTVQHYLKILLEHGYVEITGGKQRSGYEYRTTSSTSESQLQQSIEGHIKKVMEKVWKAYKKSMQSGDPESKANREKGK
jgi:DNA-binding transcriptional ArsR family regulator